MVIRVEHELHGRRRGRNLGVGLLLIGFVALIFGLTVVKVQGLGDIRAFESFDHVANPALYPENMAPQAAPAETAPQAGAAPEGGAGSEAEDGQ